MKAKILFSVFVLMLGPAAAFEIPDSEGLKEIKGEYNNQSDKVPGFVSTIVGGEKLNFRVENGTTNETVGIAFEGKEITTIRRGGIKDPTIEAWTDNETLNLVVESDDKYSELQEALNENEINYEANNLGTKVKIVIFNTLRNIANALGLT